MRASIVAASAFALGAAAWPTWTATEWEKPTPTPEPTHEGHPWGTWGGQWETKTWGAATWTQPVGAWPTGAPHAPPSPPTGGHPPSWGNPPPTNCLNQAQAEVVANNFRDTIASPFSTPGVEATFATNFQDYSDSVTELINGGCPDGNNTVPLGSPTFASLTAFIQGQSGQAPIPFNILNLWYTCTSVHIRWVSQPGPGGPTSPQEQVTGIIAIEATPNPTPGTSEPWLIETVYSEFNSGAWLYDLGVFVPPQCPAPPPP